MSRSNLTEVLSANFSATVHISLDALINVLGNAMRSGILPSHITQEKERSADGDHPDAWTEVNEVTLASPFAEAAVLTALVPIPSNILITDSAGNSIPLLDPDYPNDRQDQPVELEITIPFKLDTNNPDLGRFGIQRMEGYLEIIVRPYWSPSAGIGFIRHDFKVAIDVTAPTQLDDAIIPAIETQMRDVFYPEIVTILAKATFEFPEVNNLSVTAVRFTGNLKNERPATLSLGLGNSSDPNLLRPLLDNGDGIMLTVGKSYFDTQVGAFTKDLPRETINWEERRKETLHKLKLTLKDNAIALDAEITIDERDPLIPEADISIDGLLHFSIKQEGVESQLIADGSHLDVDLPWWLDAIRGLTDVLSLGFAEFGWSPFYRRTSNAVRGGISDQISATLNSAILGSYPSGLELFGRNQFTTRESAVLWSAPEFITIRKEGIMLGGAARGGIRHDPRPLKVSSVRRPGNTLRHFAFENEFYLSKERAIELWRARKLRIPRLELRKRGSTYYLRDRPDKSINDNLEEEKTFSLRHNLLQNGERYEPLFPQTRYVINENGEAEELSSYEG